MFLSAQVHEPGLPDKRLFDVLCSIPIISQGGTHSGYDGGRGEGGATELHIVNPEKIHEPKI